MRTSFFHSRYKSVCFLLFVCLFPHVNGAGKTDAAEHSPSDTTRQTTASGSDAFRPSASTKQLFATARREGTAILLDARTNTFYGYNKKRAETRYRPASTFKILNTLISLECGAVKDEREIIPYGGKPQYLKIWEKDMTLGEAIQAFSVPVYQELARRVGLERMAQYVQACHYGNARIGTLVDRFWLDGPLEISAMEQTGVIRNVLERKLPFASRSYDTLMHIMPRMSLEKEHNGAKRKAAALEVKEGRSETTPLLFYKTGWAEAEAGQKAVGWVVGWVQWHECAYPFALNMDMQPQDAPLRAQLAADTAKKLLDAALRDTPCADR